MKSNKPDVSIIIPNYNGEKLLSKNLSSVLAAKKYERNKIREIIIVDDGSIDNSVDLIKHKFPEVKLIKHKVNRGFSAAVNTGARTAKGKLLVLLNNDVIPEKDFLVWIIPHFKEKNVFAVSLNEKGYSWAKGKFEEGFIVHEMGPKVKKTHITFWVSGGSGSFRRSYWMKLGGMDEKLLSPFYWEDIDLCYRAAKRGLKLLWEPKARVLHKHETTLSKFPQRYVQRVRERNQLLFIWKNLTSPTLFKKHISGLFKRVFAHPGYARIVLYALFKVNIVVKARKKEKKQSRVSDEAIFASF